MWDPQDAGELSAGTAHELSRGVTWRGVSRCRGRRIRDDSRCDADGGVAVGSQIMGVGSDARAERVSPDRSVEFSGVWPVDVVFLGSGSGSEKQDSKDTALLSMTKVLSGEQHYPVSCPEFRFLCWPPEFRLFVLLDLYFSRTDSL